ncbi:hypothetical protein [Enterococcus italicus]|uniref:hypothetical protein n=1 Tax=Enterococcus italicus TaxID=246144 RepID=UPI003F449E52
MLLCTQIMDLFPDPEKMVQEKKLDYLCDKIRNRYGFKALVHASSLLPGATAISRSSLVGGHAGGMSGLEGAESHGKAYSENIYGL